MRARRVWLVAPVSLCVFLCVLVFGGGSALAAGSNPFGEWGEGAGQLKVPLGLGLDQETGDVYVPEFQNERVSKFDGSGGFLFAWGWAVDVVAGNEELQTCTVASGCRKGKEGAGSGQFAGSCGAQAVAVDNDLFSSSQHDVYVVDSCNSRVQKFDSSGKFLLMFGGHVNETQDNNPSATEAQRDVCVAGEACTRGSSGTGNGEFELSYASADIAMGPEARVYVGDENRVEVFEPSGAWRENIPLPAALTGGGGKVTALAVDPAGDSFVKAQGVPGVHELGPTGTELAVRFDESIEAIEALTRDASTGNLFIVDGTGSLHVVEYGPSGEEVASFASKTALSSKGVVYSEALHELYVADPDVEGADVWRVGAPPPGPLVEPGSEVATAGLRGAATLQATIDPEGNDTSYHFEYVDDTKFKTSGWASASSTPVTRVGVASGDFEEHSVEAVFPEKTLVAGTTYHWRVVASDTAGHTTLGATESFEEIPAARIEGPWAANVASTSVTLTTLIDPLSSNTSYRLEVAGPGYEHVFSGSVGEGMGYVTVGPFHIQGLEPHATYRYKLTTTSDVGTIEIVRSFTTQVVGSELTLPDGRAWELVSPADKKGALVEPFSSIATVPMIEAAVDGSGIAYYTTGPNLGGHPQANIVTSPALSRRIVGGWSTEDLTLPVSIGGLSEKQQLLPGVSPEYFFFSPDLSSALAEPHEIGSPPLSPEATERTPYVRDDLTGVFTPLVTPADVVPGVHFGGEGEEEKRLNVHRELMIKVLGATRDLRHVVLGSALALTPGAVATEPITSSNQPWNLYEWNEGEGLRLVNVLPNGEQAVTKVGGEGMFLGGESRLNNEVIGSVGARTVSDDGRWVAWTWERPYGRGLEHGDWSSYHGLYVRDTVAGRTYRVGGLHALYQSMNGDGSRVFYLEDGSLYVFEPLASADGVTSDLTGTLLGGSERAGVQENMIGSSEDGSYTYFVAKGVLAAGGESGEYNLYVAHDGAGGWSIGFVATLSGQDWPDWWSKAIGVWPSPLKLMSRVSPDGRYLAFMSERSLTGYDNIDAVSGRPDEEVYLFDAAGEGGNGKLACVSCDPTGARPVGVLDQWGQQGTNALPLVDRVEGGAWSGRAGRISVEAGRPHWLAGSLPPWYGLTGGFGTHQSRYLSDSGRVFFNSAGALVPQDSNGLEDVYEYEPVGVGSCATGSTTFHASVGGCVDLVSSGTSSEESDFFDASENGDDVFFITTSKLVGADYDTSFDIYDAHVCSASVPCASEPVVPPPCTSGDSCKAAPAPQPEIFGPAPSATFSGRGNVTGTGTPVVVKVRSLTRAQKLARALHACQKLRRGSGRAGCERRARKRYGVKRSRRAGASRKGQG
jgi:hypothetical protein